MIRLFSYVVDHDNGFAPNPSNGYCTLANCKCKTENGRRRNVVELAEVGDWVIGTGGAGKKSSGHGTLIYAMRVDEKLTLAEYYKDKRFKGRTGNLRAQSHRTDTFALISQHFYFGRNAIDTDSITNKYVTHPLEKMGPGFRCDFNEDFIKDFAQWLERNYELGIHGEPCGHEGRTCLRIRRKNQGRC